MLAIIVATVIVSLGSNLWGSTYLLRSDTVFNHSPWRETVPTDIAITPITGTDTVDSGFPAHAQFFGRANEGDFAAWNPYPSGGVPLGSVPNTGPFDPLNLPFLFLADEYAPTAGKVLELALAVGGMVLFLRRFGIGYSVALVGGFIYAFNGFQTFWTNWPQSHIGALIPWLFWAAEGLLTRRRTAYGGALALTVAVMFLAGFPAVTFFSLAALAIYMVARALATTKPRERLARLSRRAAATLLAVVALAGLGGGLAAWQLAPFSAQIETIDTDYRNQTSQDRLPTGALLTTAVPNVIGSFALDRTESQHNYFETQSFIGAGALVLVAAAFLRRRPRSVPRWLLPTLALMAAGVVLLTYFGGPLLALAQQLPIVGSNRIGRLRAVLLFLLSVLAALGLAAVTERAGTARACTARSGGRGWAGWIIKLKRRLSRSAMQRQRRARWLTTAVVVAAAAATVLVFWHFSAQERSHGHGGAVGRAILLAVISAGVVAAVVLLARRFSLVRSSAVVIVAIVAAVEILVLAVPWWPNTDPALHYPTTAVHDFLADEGAAASANTATGERTGPTTGERIATHELTLYAGTTGFYGLRTVSGHSFHWPTWRDMLVAIDPAAEDWNATFTILDFTDQRRMESPLLDRLAVRWIVTPLHIPPAGIPVQLPAEPAIEAGGAPVSSVRIPAGESLNITAPSQPLRGVSFYLSEALIPADPSTRLRVDVTTPSGAVVTSKRIVAGSLGPGWPWIPVAGEEIATGGEMTIAVSLEVGEGTADAGTLSLGTSADGELALFVMTPDRTDNLRLAHVSGAAVWENLDALPRIRFAANAVTVEDAAERLELLAQTRAGAELTPDAILLSDQPPPLPSVADNPATSSSPIGRILETTDTFDELSIAVESTGPGYVVVADAMQHGWKATVNSEPTPVLNADHAVVAVAVPSGTSEVFLYYDPPRLKLGLAVSALSVVILLALFATPATRRVAARVTARITARRRVSEQRHG